VSAGGAGNVAEEQPEHTGTALFRGGMIGRYIVLGLLGKGGMGVVYSAYDPELDRKVALKLLRVTQGRKGADLDAKRTRLLREAKAIARLSHPNVVVVYDVGTFQDQVFISMELVDGLTATRWRDAKKPTWKEVLRVFIAAGEGIAAAHAADLIHRDLKPDNVMVSTDGKVRVMDFGLARTVERLSEETPMDRIAAIEGDGPTLPGARPHESRLTNEGNVVGTPAYMPPEQYLGVTDERSDQFAFCVSLYECLYGQHPFEARTSMGMTSNIQAGRVHEAPANAKVPLWVRKILLRGMKPRPEDRYPTMRELLDALGRDPAVARKRWLVAGAMVAAAAGLALGFQRAADRSRAFCAAGPEKLAAAWELPGHGGGAEGFRHAAVRRAFVATGKQYAPDAIRAVASLLDGYAARWADVYRDTCEATHVRGEQSEELLDLRMSCLNDRLSGLRALTDVFISATGEVVEHAVDAAHALTPLDGCSDVKQLKSLIPPPDNAVRARVDALRREMGQIKAVHDAGRYRLALDRLKPVATEAHSLAYRPLEAEALARMGTASSELGQNSEAEKILEQALDASVAAHHDDLLPEISAWLVWVVGFQRRFDDADRWRRFAEATIERTGQERSVAYSWLLNNVGVVYHLQGRFAEALEYQERARAIKEKALGTNDLDVALTLGNMALTLTTLQRPEEALKLSDQCLHLLRLTLGDSHPKVASELSNQGEILLSLGRPHEALASYRKAQTIWERELGPDDPSVAYALAGNGRAAVALGRPRDAIEPLEHALQIRRKADSDAGRLGETEFALAKALWDSRRDPDRAQRLARQALEHYATLPGVDKARSEIATWLAAHRDPG
jgi:tetratricopeptide (TPR) repeat protein/tRNA A-37 threonylcarbamoyl transferase component Bud32